MIFYYEQKPKKGTRYPIPKSLRSWSGVKISQQATTLRARDDWHLKLLRAGKSDCFFFNFFCEHDIETRQNLQKDLKIVDFLDRNLKWEKPILITEGRFWRRSKAANLLFRSAQKSKSCDKYWPASLRFYEIQLISTILICRIPCIKKIKEINNNFSKPW